MAGWKILPAVAAGNTIVLKPSEMTPGTSEMPHGGYKASGFGKDMSVFSLEEYTQVRHVLANHDTNSARFWHEAVCRG